ncbi:MAG: tetratricopeptide repeat protein [Pedobacter sp.]|nr:MAG: tetratricopeptide repeat protein [Pedobacter sp.]
MDLYNKAINISADVSTYNNIGVSYYMLQKYDKAIEQYKKALQINPNHADSRNNLGMTFEVLGKKDEAAAEYKKACDLGVKDKCGFK